jgi:hypothetical protein
MRLIGECLLALAGALFFIVYLWAAVALLFALGVPYVPAP